MLCGECNPRAAYGCLHSVFADLLFGFLFICFLAVLGLCCGAWARGLSSCSARASLVADVGSLVEVHHGTLDLKFPNQGLNPCPLYWRVES